MAKGKLHELLAVLTSIDEEARKIVDETKVTFTKKAHLFVGQSRRLTMFSESRAGENTIENKDVDETVMGKLGYMMKSLVRSINAAATREQTNAIASAEVMIDGQSLFGRALPATALLMLEDKLRQIRSVVELVPTLEPGISWIPDPQFQDGRYCSAVPEISFREEKEVQHKILTEAIVRDGVGIPAQIEKWTANIRVGRYEAIKKSGTISPAQKSDILGRVDKLLRAVKSARARANATEIEDVKIGATIADFILDASA